MFILNIPEPCHERWDEMTPEAKGRFCGSCQKIVVDFTGMSDEQVKNYLLDQKNKNTCGRFYATQIGRPLENKSIQIDLVWYQRLPYARQVFYAFAVFFVLGVSSCDFKGSNNTTAPKQDSTKQINTTPQMDTNIKKGEIAIETLPIKKDTVLFTPPQTIKCGEIKTEDIKEYITGLSAIADEPQKQDTIREIMGKTAAPKPIIDSTQKPEPMIMGGISLPPKHFEKDNSIHIKKPRR